MYVRSEKASKLVMSLNALGNIRYNKVNGELPEFSVSSDAPPEALTAALRLYPRRPLDHLHSRLGRFS